MIDGVVFDTLVRPDLALWYCGERHVFWSATWLAALFSQLGAEHDLARIAFQINERGIEATAFALDEATNDQVRGVIGYADRRALVSLYEKQGNFGLWSFALLSAEAPVHFNDFRSALTHAKAAFEIELDSIAQGFDSGNQ